MTAVGIIGAGAVGQAVGMLLAASGWCRTVAVASRSGRSAAALVTDLEDMGQAGGSPVRLVTAAPAHMRACDAVVVCPRAAFTNTATRDVRMAGLRANGVLLRRLARHFTAYSGVVLVVTNPVDVMTRLFAEESGCARVLGVGSNTDTARYRAILARRLRVPPAAVHGHVIGEHGDHAVICASTTTVHGRPLPAPVPVPVTEIREELAARPGRIADGIGRTRCGPAAATVTALAHALGVTDGVVELSAHWRDGVHLGVPLHFTGGRRAECMPTLAPDEASQLAAAESKLRAAYETLQAAEKEKTPA
ncbi:lactate/malate family dehydrogenase [Streptomyces fradiae]|uniref:lactate/malate family dehydrogenase n=1 Tax=Streptomyces fradiae TaxID=1906 RepID=UPI002943F6C5|nr:NAD(P)-binding domain-containing protein [Streptomyces fradiae]WOI62177.1 NAD(P)-binding domain-containing protein [Streptomyces fradiae]